MGDYYPVFLDVRERKCLVVGGGSVALRKVEALSGAGARVRVVAPSVCDALQHLPDVEVEQRAFREADLDGVFLAIAATDDTETNRRVADLAERSGIPVNAVDQPDAGSFIVPATVGRGPLTLAVSTGGASPALARRIREELEQLYGPEYEEFVQLLRELRPTVLEAVSQERRRQAFTELASAEVFAELKERGIEAARDKMNQIIARHGS